MSKNKGKQNVRKSQEAVQAKLDSPEEERAEEIIVWKSLMIVATLTLAFYIFVLSYTGKW